MLPEAFRVDELGLVDDPIDLPMGGNEFEERLEGATFRLERAGRRLQDGRDLVADLSRHVAHEFLEDRLLAVEIGVESTQSDAGAAGDPDDRALGKTLFAELLERCVEDLAERPLPARRARRLAVAGGARCVGFPTGRDLPGRIPLPNSGQILPPCSPAFFQS